MTFLYEGILPQRYDFKFSSQLLCGAIAVALLIISSKIQVPMIPVPMTFQTAIVLLLPALLGTKLALSAIMAWFGMGMVGLPVFAMTAGSIIGPAYFLGASGGYLIGFAVAALAVGCLFQLFDKGRNIHILFLCMLFGHVIILTFGVLWMAYGMPNLGLETAIATGLMPFFAGMVLKSMLSACLIKSFEKPSSSA